MGSFAASESWLVSAAVRELVGDDSLHVLDNLDPSAALTCQICGRVKPAGVRIPLAVIAAPIPGGFALGIAHPACRDSQGDIQPHLQDQAEQAETDARAAFATRPGPAPSAVLIFEGSLMAAGSLRGRISDLIVEHYLAEGFTAAQEPLLTLTAPLTSHWVIDTRRGELALRRSSGNSAPAYCQDIDASHAAWLRLARRQGRCLVVTGTHLGLAPGAALPQDFAWAREHGTLVAATVPVR